MRNYLINVILYCVVFCLSVNFSWCQEKVKPIFHIQTGFLGTWVGAEFPVTKNFILRAETGLDVGIYGNSTGSNFMLAPVFTLEPRYYYNLKKRNEGGENTRNNAGNFFGIKTSYHPDSFVISRDNDVNVEEQLSVIPKWGMRRNFGKSNWNYEIGIGIGQRFYLGDSNDSELISDLHLRIGYTF